MSQVLPFVPPLPSSSVRDVVESYLSFAAPRSSPAVAADRLRILGDFVGALGDLDSLQLKPLHLWQWLSRHGSWCSGWTRKRNVSYVLACFAWAASTGLIEASPFGGARLRLPAGDRRRPVDDGEFRALLRASAADLRRVLLFLRLSGSRPDEMSRLTWADVRWDDGIAVLHEHKARHVQRRPVDRVIGLHPVVLRLLSWLRRRAGSSGRIFVNRCGQPWNRHSLAHRVARARRRAGLPRDVCLYGLRHSFVTAGLMRGVPLAVMADMVGHGSTAMTEHYAHVARQRRELRLAVVQAVGSGLGGAHSKPASSRAISSSSGDIVR